ncbi:MAG: transglycosylase domain-containing protein, partial [Bacteroidetes bacterium]|nr:transglycosylase domain-containing protein [Bacteroidota bacterium]
MNQESQFNQHTHKSFWHRFKAYYLDHRYDYNRLPLLNKIGIGLCVMLLLIMAGTFLFYQAVRLGAFGDLPDHDELMVIQNAQASEVYAADGKLLGRYYVQERTTTPYEEISPNIITALLSTEDARFYEHNGIDNKSILRVIVKTMMLQEESSGGGSTISQQLAKNLFPRNNRYGRLSLPIAKVKEMIIAKRLEKVYPKNEILALYLNTVPFSDNAYGIETASERYFSKSSKELNQQEAATLVGMLKATTGYNPRLHPERAKGRRNVVIGQIERYGHITSKQADSLQSLPLELKYNRQDHNDGLATYFRSHLKQELQRWAAEHKKPDGSAYNVYRDGLRIYTTIDTRLQSYAEQAVKTHLTELQRAFYKHWGRTAPWKGKDKILINAIHRSARYKQLKAEGLEEKDIQKEFSQKVSMKIFTWQGERDTVMAPLDSVKHYLYFLNAGFMAMDPHSGHIKAWVGGIDHKYFKYDHVNLKTRRQVGSTFKPIVYAAALQQGADPCTYISAERETYPEMDNWSPGNSDGNYEGDYTLEGGLMNSVNTVSVKVLKRTGLTNAINMARAMGIKNEIPKMPSIALGTPELSLYEMVMAYGTFANKGKSVTPVYLLRIEDSQGNVLQEFSEEPKSRLALEPEKADMMVNMLRSVVNKGTAGSLRWKYKVMNDMAGKTGTTEEYRDAWFVGYTPELVAAVWVGHVEGGIPMRTENAGGPVTGGSIPASIWRRFMTAALEGRPVSTFEL